MDDTIRWSVTVSRELDRSVRALVSGKAGRAGSISGFVERAVRKELFGRTVEAVRARNREVAPEVIAAEVEAAVAQVRAVKSRRPRR